MAYLITIESEEGTIGGKTVQVVFEMLSSGSGSPVSYDAETAQFLVEELGDLEYSFELEDLLMIPGALKLKLFDKAGFFLGLIKQEQIEKIFKVKLLIDGSPDFFGRVQEDSIIYDVGKKRCEMVVDCHTEVINKKMCYDLDDNALNPFGYLLGEWPAITDVILDIFQLIDAGITVDIQQNWVFKGEDTGGATAEFDFEDLEVFTDDIYLNASSGVRNVGDVLKAFAADTGSITGVLDINNAFFRKLFYYDASNLQTVASPLKHRITFPYPSLDYVATKVGGSVAYEEGVFTELEGKYLTREPFLTASTSSTLLRGQNIDGIFFIYEAKDPTVENTFEPYQNVLTKFWYSFRNAPLRVDEFEMRGTDYNFIKSFNYDNGKYQIIKLKKRYSVNKSEITAIYLGELS